jgi:hypothetical protein
MIGALHGRHDGDHEHDRREAVREASACIDQDEAEMRRDHHAPRPRAAVDQPHQRAVARSSPRSAPARTKPIAEGPSDRCSSQSGKNGHVDADARKARRVERRQADAGTERAKSMRTRRIVRGAGVLKGTA